MHVRDKETKGGLIAYPSKVILAVVVASRMISQLRYTVCDFKHLTVFSM